MLSDLFISLTDAVFSYAIDKLDPAERIKSWLKRDPVRLGFQKALARSYSAFARQYPDYTTSLFDKSFLEKEAAPELAKLLVLNQFPDPALFAQAWGKSLGLDSQHEFCQRATKPASNFLTWLEAELRAEPAFQALFDSRALDSLPKIESEIAKLTTEIKRGLDEALKQANEYEKEIVKIGGSVTGSNIVVGDNNQVSISNIYHQYYSGDYARLNDYYISPDGVFQRVRVEEFIGRAWLTAKVDDFLNNPKQKSGMFLLVGDAGVGKTSFMAHLVQERRYLHLFGEQIPGDANLPRALQSLGSQLVTRYQIDPYKDRDTLTQLAVFPDFLERLLRQAASKLTTGEKIVIVCDALDEVGTFPDGNVLGLPNVLPDGVYFILSQRPANAKLPNLNLRCENLEAQGEGNLADMEAYLSMVAKRPEIAGQIRSKGYSEEKFIQALKEKSLGVWMYLHYVIREIENGSRAPLDLENLPTGLVGYYADFWGDWRNGRKGRGEGPNKWDGLYAPLLTTLTAAQEPITIEKLIEWAEVSASPREVGRLLREAWRAFITEQETTRGKLFKPYHLSFRDFISGKVDFIRLSPAQSNLVEDLAAQTIEAHQRIVKIFEKECNSQWEKLAEQEYPRLHLCAHLYCAHEYEKLTRLLTKGDVSIAWAEARYEKDETYAGYLYDLEYVWQLAEIEKNYVLLVRIMLIESSLHSLAGRIPPQLLVELAKNKLWSYARCLAILRQKPDPKEQAETIKLMAPDIPSELWQETLAVLSEIQDEFSRASMLPALAPHLPKGLKVQASLVALAAAREFQDKFIRASILFDLAPHLPEELKVQALAAMREIEDNNNKASMLSALAPHLPKELKAQALLDALAAAREIQKGEDRVHVLSNLVPHLPEELKAQVLLDALAAASEIQKGEDRARAMSSLAPYLPEELKTQALLDAIAAAREIQKGEDRARAMSSLAPHLPEELKTQALLDALAAAREIQDENYKVSMLTSLAPHLTEELKTQVLLDALAATSEIQDKNYKVSMLSVLASHLPEELKAQALLDALAAAREIQYENDRARALSSLVPNLPDELKAQVLAAACEIQKGNERAYVLSSLAPYLPEELKTQALAAACEVPDNNRVSVLTSLAPHLHEELKVQVLLDVLATTHKIQDVVSRVYTLSNLASHLPEELKVQALLDALAAAREIQKGDDKARALSKLAPYLPEELKAQTFLDALAAAHEIQNEYFRACTLSNLASYLPEELKAQALLDALTAAREIQDEHYKVSELTSLAPHLPEEFKAQALLDALAAAREIQEENYKVSMLTSLAPHLPEELKALVLLDALAAAREIQKGEDRARAMSSLAPHLPEELKAQVLLDAIAAAREIQGEFSRASMLSDMAPYLPEELKAQVLLDALAAAREIQDENYKVSMLTSLAPHLPEELKTQALLDALAAAREIQNKNYKVNMLSVLAPHLPEELKTQALLDALAVAREIQDEFYRASALSSLVPHLAEELKAQVLLDSLAATREIQKGNDRARALYELAEILDKQAEKVDLYIEILFILDNRVVGPSLQDLMDNWQKEAYTGLDEKLIPFMRFKAQQSRDKSLEAISALTDALNHLAGRNIAPEIFAAITDVTRWWP